MGHAHHAVLRVIIAASAAAALGATASASSIGGIVTASGLPVANARMTLFVPDLASFAETRTAANGSYLFNGESAGTYQLGAAGLGFNYVQVPVTLGASPAVQNFALNPESHPGAWNVIGDTLPELFDATDIGILLSNGSVFFCHDTVDPIQFDPVSGLKTFPAGSPVEQGCMNATLLEDGRIIMVGGQSPSDPGAFTQAVPWVKCYRPALDAWQWMAPLQLRVGRWYTGLARLADGSLMVMGGGTSPSAERTDTCERFDLKTLTWSYTGTMLNPTEFPPSALLYNGLVLATWYPPQLYNPVTEKWIATGNFVQPNRLWPGHSDHSLVVLANGKALAIGVRRGPDQNTHMLEIYDPVTGTWSLGANPALVRQQPEVVALPDGRILVAAGQTEQLPPPVPHVLGVVKWSDLYDPAVDQWRRVADMIHFREYHAVTLLVPDGRVITTGGTRIQFQFGPTSADIEAFSPPYLFRGVRPQITSISTTTAHRGSAIGLTIQPQTELTSIVLMGTQTTTHWVEGGIPRRLVLPVVQRGPDATVNLPTDPNLLPLGHYMLFAMVDDIPSTARIINVVNGPAADLNGDGVVNSLDLGILLSNWSIPPTAPACSGASPCPSDLNGDGVVNTLDLGILLVSWTL